MSILFKKNRYNIWSKKVKVRWIWVGFNGLEASDLQYNPLNYKLRGRRGRLARNKEHNLFQSRK